MPKLKTTFAKIVGSPTEAAWSQAYAAGDLYILIALSKKDAAEELSLNVVGKGILNNVEAEFFTLEEKSLAAIKTALANALTSTPESIQVHLALCYIKQNLAYLFSIGNTKITLRRGTQTGVILAGRENTKEPRAIHASSGPLKDADLLILTTEAFSTLIPEEEMLAALNNASLTDVEETLIPQIHAKEAGDAGALFIRAHAISEETESDEPTAAESQEPGQAAEVMPIKEPAQQPPAEEEEPAEQSLHHTPESETEEPQTEKKFRFPTFPFRLPNLGNKRLLILAVAIILSLALGGSIYTVNSNREKAQTNAAFQEIYDKALKDYDLGVSLEELNKNVAMDNFLKAQQTLEANKEKFKEGTEEREKIEELLQKVNSKLGGAGSSRSVETQKVDDASSSILSLQKSLKTPYVSHADNTYYSVTDDTIIQTDASGEDTDELYENDNDWSDIAGIGAFGSNVYVLDRKEGVLKFVAGANGYGKQSYFTGDAPNLNTAADMAIDGSVWILMKNGAILKYTRGEKDAFSISALQVPFKNPTRIVTSEEADNLYILDRGNNRVVVLSKDGIFKTAYTAAIFSNATGIAVNEDETRLFALSGDSIYELKL